MYADLHNHTVYSDGTDTPLALCRRAAEYGLRVISITDHDSIGAYAELNGTPRPLPVDIIPGVEISVEIDHVMIHILGYFIDVNDLGLIDLLARMAADKTESSRLNFERAKELGLFDYEWSHVISHYPGKARIGGVCTARAIEAAGIEVHGMSHMEMCSKVFMPSNPDYISVSTVTARNTIESILNAGGVPVIAHPGSLGDDKLVMDLIRQGLRGIEAFHPAHNDNDARRYLRMARDNGLYITGGTDWHGGNNAGNRAFASHGLEDDSYGVLRHGKYFV